MARSDLEDQSNAPLLSEAAVKSAVESEKKYGTFLTISEEEKCVSSDDNEPETEKPALNSFVLSRKNEKRAMFSLAIMGVLMGSMEGIMIPFLPLEAARRSCTQTQASGVFSIFATTKLLLSPVVGRLVICFGVNRLYCFGMATAGWSTMVFGTLSYIGDCNLFLYACYLVRVIEAVGVTTMVGSAFTIIGSHLPQLAGSAVALVTATIGLGVSLSPVVGGGLYALAGFGAAFYATGFVIMVAAVGNHWLLPPLPIRAQKTRVSFWSMFCVVSRSAENWLCLGVVFVYWTTWLSLTTSVTPYAARELGIPNAAVGVYFVAPCIVYIIASYLWAKVLKRINNPYIMISLCIVTTAGAQLLMAPSPLLVGLRPHWALLGSGMVLMYASFSGAYIPCFQLMLSASIDCGLPDDTITHAFVSSVYWTGCSLGAVLGPLLAGLLVDWWGFPVMMTYAAGLNLLMALLTTVQAVRSGCTRASGLVV